MQALIITFIEIIDVFFCPLNARSDLSSENIVYADKTGRHKKT